MWRLDRAIAVQIIETLTGLSGSGRPCHIFVEDMASPGPTLVLSLAQYISPNWLTAGKEPIFGDDED